MSWTPRNALLFKTVYTALAAATSNFVKYVTSYSNQIVLSAHQLWMNVTIDFDMFSIKYDAIPPQLSAIYTTDLTSTFMIDG